MTEERESACGARLPMSRSVLVARKTVLQDIYGRQQKIECFFACVLESL